MIKVLIVDDDKLARKGLVILPPWSKYNMEVVGDVQNGRLALEYLKNHPVDLVVTDIEMPEMNGIELIEQCKQEFPVVEFVVLTFFEEFQYAQRAIRNGVLDYMVKTEFDPELCGNELGRIHQKYFRNKENQKTSDTELEETYLIQTEWNAFKEKWYSLHWVFDDAKLHTLEHLAIQYKLSPRQVDRVVVKCVHKIDEELEREESAVPMCQSLEQLFQWLRQWKDSLYQSIRVSQKTTHLFGGIMKAVSLMEEGFVNEQIYKEEELAEQIGINRSYFSSNFKKYTGKSFHEYLKERKMEAVCILLKERESAVTDIALSLGYNDISYFNKQFRERFGCTPKEYRSRKGAAY